MTTPSFPFAALLFPSTGFFFPRGLTFEKKCVKFLSRKATTKTRVLGQLPREGPVCCNGPAFLPETIPLPSRIGGNAMPGAPVTASMSDGVCRNQGGTVEYFCIPPLILSGDGYFLYLPQD